MNSTTIQALLNLALLVRVRHWQTDVYAEHIALGNLYDKLEDFIDKWVETNQAVGSRISFEEGAMLALGNVDSVSQTLDELDSLLRNTLEKEANGTEFRNMRDDILGDLKRTQYLLTLT